jgi:tellurite resistance protein TehA-like permease
MGATAIVTLAAARILAQPALPPLVDSARPFIVGLTFALWAWGTWCVPFLAYLGVKQVFLARVPLRYNTGLWSIVFPAGMYSAACIFFGRTTHATPLVIVGTGVAWVAAALWLATCAFAVVALFRAKPWLRSPSRRPRY